MAWYWKIVSNSIKSIYVTKKERMEIEKPSKEFMIKAIS